jgi:hypothetical protein
MTWNKVSRLQAALWIAFISQLVLVFFGTMPWMTNDSPRYLELAQALADWKFGSVTSEGFQPEAITPPGYPALLGILLHGLGMSIAAVVAAQLAIYALCAFLLDRAVRKEDAGLANLFLLAVAGYVIGPAYVSSIMAEAFATLALTIIALVLMGREPFTPKQLAAVGLVSGLASLFRPDLLLLPALIGLIAFFQEPRGQRAILRRAVRGAVPILAAILVLLPYAAWNSANFGRFSPVPRAGAVGTSLYLATWQRQLPLADLNALHEGRITPRAERAGLGREVVRLNSEIGAPALTAVWSPMAYRTRETQIRSTDVTLKAALERIKVDPGNYMHHVVANIWDLWNTSHYPESVPAFVRIALTVISAVATILGLCGAALGLLGVRGWPLTRGVALLLLYLPAVHIWLHTEARYTAPARLLLLLHGAAFAWWLWQRYLKNAKRFQHAAPA